MTDAPVFDFGTEYADLYLKKSALMIPAYEDLFRPAHAWLRLLLPASAHLLLVGGGGGKELQTFGPHNPGWRFTVVDPAPPMAQAARAKAAATGLAERATVVTGLVSELPAAPSFDAATSILVQHFLPAAGQAALLRDIARRLPAGAPLVLAQLSRPASDAELDLLMAAWREHQRLCGDPPEEVDRRARGFANEVTLLTESQLRELFAAAGFTVAAAYHQSILFRGWFLRRT